MIVFKINAPQINILFRNENIYRVEGKFTVDVEELYFQGDLFENR